ncbi:MAG TPA: hypothetical protein VFR58_07305 [Flavisolibacter sp.]|nr:hypothetical protein [Flavisolibacter sp.]
MIAKFRPNKIHTNAEKFLAQKLLELFFNKTLDSHRAKLNNPRWILIELSQVLGDWNEGKIKVFDKTIKPVLLETTRFLEGRHYLQFGEINEKYFRTLLGSCTDKSYQHLSYATSLLCHLNQNFLDALFDSIEKEISRLNVIKFTVDDLNELSKLTDFLATELINRGHAKAYLYSITWRIFEHWRQFSFPEALAEFKGAINRELEDFTVVFKLNKLGGGTKKIDIKSEYEIGYEKIQELSKINNKAAVFFSKQGDFGYFLAMELPGRDYLSVIEKAKKEVFSLIDLINMGYPDNPFDFSKKCLVVGKRKPELTNVQPVFYTPDGAYINNEKLYDLLLEKSRRILNNRSIQKESIQKIVSAFRHLRLGRDADELEQKFLNYWIGLEYIFSNYDVHDTTITRLKEYFIHSHSVAYFKRNLREFHNDIVRLGLKTHIPNFDNNLDYLKDAATYDNIIDKFFDEHPLLAFRAHKYRQLITGTKKIGDEIIKHRTNLEWHLTRCYRIRNEIVHDAAIHLNIESITGNLRYYLTYILNGLLEYLDTSAEKSMDRPVTISDYFLLQEIKYESLSKSGFQLEKLMAEKSVTEIFSK